MVIFLLCLTLVKATLSFTPSIISVDAQGNRVSNPESGTGFVFDQNYKFNSALLRSASYYSSYYYPEYYMVTEEVVDNYNRIGDKIGTHWIACKGRRNISYVTIPVNGIIEKVRTLWTKLGPVINIEKLFNNTEVKLPVGKSITFQRCMRDAVSDINVYDPSTGTEGVEKLPTLSNNPSLKRILNVHIAGEPYTSIKCLASAYVILGKGDSDPWSKPLIVVDGFDPRSRIGIQEILENVPNSLAPSAYKFMKTVLDQGHDVIFVDFSDGGSDIIDNAKVLLKIIEVVCNHANNNVIVSGYSMGGLLARAALLLGERNNLQCMNKVSRFLSIDSPQLGGQVNTDMQGKLLNIANNRLDKPSNYIAYELIASVAFDLQSKAAKQMLFTHVCSAEHDEFFSFIKSIGDYPCGIKKYAIGDAAWKWPYPQADINGQFAATFNGSNMYLRNEDLFPGSYIDLWAAEANDVSGFLPAFFPAFGTKYIKEYLGITTVVPTKSTFGDSRYKPTHIPLFSAFGIDKNQFVTIAEPQNQTDLDIIADNYSPFDKLYLIDNNIRPRHIEFDELMADKVLKSLEKPDISAFIFLMLSD